MAGRGRRRTDFRAARMQRRRMGDAYAKATGELTLVSVHSGPGLTNALTGIGEAAKSRTPLVVLAGDVPNGAVKNNFYIEQAEMVRAVGAVSERLHTPGSAREDMLRAVTRALRDRQTVVLSMPLDVQHAPLAVESAAARIAAGARPAASRSARRRAARRCVGARAAPAHSRRPRRGDLRCRAGAGRARRQRRRAIGDIGVRPRAVFGKSLVGRHQRRLLVAGRRRADFRERFHPGVRRQPDAMDHQEGQTDRARRRGGAGRCRCAETRLSDAGAARGAWRCQGDGAGVAGGDSASGEAAKQAAATTPCASASASGDNHHFPHPG